MERGYAQCSRPCVPNSWRLDVAPSTAGAQYRVPVLRDVDRGRPQPRCAAVRNVGARVWWALPSMFDVQYRSRFWRCGASRLDYLRWHLCWCADYEVVSPGVFPKYAFVGGRLCAM